MTATTPAARGFALRAGCLIAAVGIWAGSAASAARADSIAQAEGQARVILGQVRDLQRQTAAARAAYDTALAAITSSVTGRILAERDIDDRERAAAAAQQQLNARARALYMSGGPLALYSTLFDADNVSDFAWRNEMLSGVLAMDRSAARSLEAAVSPARAAAGVEADALQRQLATGRTVRAALRRLDRLLARQQRLLNAARTQVRRLKAAAAERARLAAVLAAQRAAVAAVTEQRIATARASTPSAEYLRLYRAAATTCPGLSWTVLAAIGQVESGHGANASTSPAGAMGPMQFLPTTFAAYAVDGDGDGRADIHSPADSIYSAAYYLCRNGAGSGPAGLARALWRYNHADWYVRLVLRLAAQYADPDS